MKPNLSTSPVDASSRESPNPPPHPRHPSSAPGFPAVPRKLEYAAPAPFCSLGQPFPYSSTALE